jgi:hypothetical protein
MKPKFLSLLCATFLGSCASIPKESVDLMMHLQKEGERMHAINLQLVNHVFQEKSKKIDEFIVNEYIEDFAVGFTRNIPDEVNLHREFAGILAGSLKPIIARRNEMQLALENNRIKIISSLEADFRLYQEACLALHHLLISANKVQKERALLLGQLQNYTPRLFNIEQLDSALETFINSADEYKFDAYSLNENIDELLNN